MIFRGNELGGLMFVREARLRRLAFASASADATPKTSSPQSPQKPHHSAPPLAPGRDVLLHRLARLKALSDDDVKMLDDVIRIRTKAGSDEILLGEDALCSRPRFLLSGWACRQLVLADGRRQIFTFLIPGDILTTDYERFFMGTTVALTPVITSELPRHDAPGGLYAAGGLLALALEFSKQEREHHLHQQVLRLGGMNARERIVHLLSELCERSAYAGLFDGEKLPFPLTQEVLGDALGMSLVHVNRTLQGLRRERVIANAGHGMLQIAKHKLSALALDITGRFE